MGNPCWKKKEVIERRNETTKGTSRTEPRVNKKRESLRRGSSYKERKSDRGNSSGGSDACDSSRKNTKPKRRGKDRGGGILKTRRGLEPSRGNESHPIIFMLTRNRRGKRVR